MSESSLIRHSFRRLLTELLNGVSADSYGYMLNPGSAGLLAALKRLDAAQAAAIRIPGRASIAAQANHVCFVLNVMNRKYAGAAPFPDEAWAVSWEVEVQNDEQWQALLERLRDQAQLWKNRIGLAGQDTVKTSGGQENREEEMTEQIASIAHLAYHFGAIRQLLGIEAPLTDGSR